MSKKNNKARALKQHKAKLDRNTEREKKMEAKMKEVQDREAESEREAGEEDWEDVEPQMDEERAEEEATMQNELPNKKIKKDKVKFKIFQKRIIQNEKKRARKAKKSGVVVYKKAMQTE